MAKGSFDRSSCVTKYLKEISEFPLLTKDEERAIAVRMRDDSSDDCSYHDLVKCNLSFVVKVASEYRNMDMSYLDDAGTRARHRRGNSCSCKCSR